MLLRSSGWQDVSRQSRGIAVRGLLGGFRGAVQGCLCYAKILADLWRVTLETLSVFLI